MSRAFMAMLIVGAMCGRVQAQSMPVDVEERGVAAASGPVGPGGQAALSVQPETPRGGEAERVPT